MNTTFTGTITTTCPCGRTHLSSSTVIAQHWLRTHSHTKGWNPMQVALHHPTPIVVPVPVKGARFARITPTGDRFVLRLVDGTADIAYRDRSAWVLQQFTERWFGCPLRWQRTDDGILWVAP